MDAIARRIALSYRTDIPEPNRYWITSTGTAMMPPCKRAGSREERMRAGEVGPGY